MKLFKNFSFATSVIVIALVILAGCKESFVVKTHHGFMNPDVYELTNGDIAIKYYNGNCCCIAKDVLTELKNRIEKNEIVIDSLKSKKFVDNYLRDLCWILKARQDLEEGEKIYKSLGMFVSIKPTK